MDLLYLRAIGLPFLLVCGVIAVGVSRSVALRLVGLTIGADTFYLALGVQFGAAAVALALFTIGLVRRRRRTSAR